MENITTADAPDRSGPSAQPWSHDRARHRDHRGHRGRRAAGLALIAGLAMALAACGGDDGGGGTDGSDTGGLSGDQSTTSAAGGSAGAVSYQVSDLSYNDVSAPAGGTIEIDNTSGVSHTFTSDDDAFDEVEYGSEGTATVQVPDQPGEYPFHCEIHSSMRATLTVE